MVLYPFGHPFLAALSEYPTIGESIAYQLNGLIVVFLALSSIWALTELIGAFFRVRSAQESAAVKARAAAAPIAANADGANSELIAVIVASVASVIDQPHRIMAIAPVHDDRDWAREGRREIFASHRTR